MITVSKLIQYVRAHWHEPQVLYAGVALVWGLVQVFILPPYLVPDEPAHYHRAWGLAQGVVVCPDDNLVPVPFNVVQFYSTNELPIGYPGSYSFAEDAYSFADEPFVAELGRPQSSACTYNPLSYVPSAVGINVARVLHLTPFHAFYLARIANLLVGIGLTVWAIKRAPFGKWIFALTALLPMAVQQYASVNIDAITIPALLLFTALVLSYSQKAALSRRDMIWLVVASLLLVQLKAIYAPLLLLFLVLRPRQFGSWWKYAGYILVAALLNILVAWLVYKIWYPTQLLQPSAEISPATQLAFLREHPTDVIRIIHNDYLSKAVSYVFSMVGAPGWLQFTYPAGFYLLMGLGWWVAITSNPEEVRLNGWQRVVMLGASYLTLIGFGAFMFVYWVVPGSTGLDGIQGRYFIPLIPVVLLAGYGVRVANAKRALLIGSVVGLTGLIAIGGVREFFYLEPYQSTIPKHSSAVERDYARAKLVNLERTGDELRATSDDPQIVLDARDVVGFSFQVIGSGPMEIRYQYAGSSGFDESHVDTVNLPAIVPNHTFTPRRIDLDLTLLESSLGRDIVAVRFDPTTVKETVQVLHLDTYLP